MFFPRQGEWTVDRYLELHTNRLVEYVEGTLEFLEMPTLKHQAIVAYLYSRLSAAATARRVGKIYFAPLRIWVAPDRIREPDVVFLKTERLPADRTRPPQGADLVIEVISPGPESRERDEVEKREDYAKAAIEEYWIVDPENNRISVLGLSGGEYAVIGEYGLGQVAVSRLLPDFTVPVTEAFEAE
jgi:Uma2 family endonuclease